MRPRILATAAVIVIVMGLGAAPSHATPLVSTSISFTSPTVAQVGMVNTLSVTVAATDGVTQPVGGVVFTNGLGEVLGSSTTSRGGSVSSAVATLQWVPTQEIAYTFNATYYPTDGSILTSSTTATPISVLATPTGQIVSLGVTQMYRGVVATMTATVFPSTLQGSVGFTANGYGLGPSVPVVNGAASFRFVPGSLGWQQFGVSFTANSNPNINGAASQWVNVLPALGVDDITLNPTPTSMANGQSVTLNPSTTSGATSTLSASSGCTLAGTVLTATSGSGNCLVTASTYGAGGYLPATESWTIALTPGRQTATISAPPSGGLAVGRTVTLTAAGTVTNAGQRISWRVTKGSAVCSLKTRSGATRLTMDATGTCKVRGSAPTVAGQWNAYSVGRAYTAR